MGLKARCALHWIAMVQPALCFIVGVKVGEANKSAEPFDALYWWPALLILWGAGWAATVVYALAGFANTKTPRPHLSAGRGEV